MESFILINQIFCFCKDTYDEEIDEKQINQRSYYDSEDQILFGSADIIVKDVHVSTIGFQNKDCDQGLIANAIDLIWEMRKECNDNEPKPIDELAFVLEKFGWDTKFSDLHRSGSCINICFAGSKKTIRGNRHWKARRQILSVNRRLAFYKYPLLIQ